ncbi:PAS domain-containing protein [Flavobacteriaceae bacterium F89]|uniref:histidine kinase n=1 Tax=Cerina litoralis TaxID=2874477 RepID=A0AAE3ETF7_9FLAO|nr:PAS domain-containing protein [Cerina litoralis]MCG2460113.1 PAS domain-containing protein [Cerina litoralis]
MGNNNKDYGFLQGGGEMGKLIRAHDWSKTPLGDPNTWPQPLCTMVSVMLDNPFGMYIAWGKDFTQIYNDGYRPILGATKHPQALGIGTRKTFSEIWHVIGPMFDGVMNGEAVGFPDFMLQLDRNGYVENCYFDFAYSPIRLESGEVGGVLVTVIETTARKKAQDELIASKNELEFVLDAARLGTFDYNPITDKFSGNTRLKEWFGLPSGNQLGLKHAIGVIAEKDKERISNTIKEVMDRSSEGDFDVEYCVVNPISGKEIVVHAKGKAWFNEEGIAYRLNGTVEDITEQTIANRRSKENEQHIRTMVSESPVGICVLDADTLVSEIVNDSFIEIAGKPRDAIVGKFYWDTFAEVRVQYEDALNKVIALGEAFYADEAELMLLRHGEEEIIYVTFVFAPLKDENGKVVKVAVWVLDNTVQVEARKKIMVSENNLRLMILQAPVAIAIFRGTDYRVEIANKFALEIWGRTEEQVLNTPFFDAIPELLTQGIKEFLDDVAKTGNRFATPEMPVQIMRNGVLETEYVNFSFEPLYDSEEKINGIMAIGFDITPQIEARKRVEESEQGIRALVESAPFPIGVFVGKEMRISLANQSIMDAWGKGNDVIGKLYSDILPEFENQQIFEQLRQVLKTGTPFHAKNQKVDIFKNGELCNFYYNYSFTPLMDDNGNTYAVMNTAAEVTELHQAKQKVEESEKRFRDSVKQAPLGIAIFRGPDYVAEMANDNYLLIVDKTEEQFVGKPLFETLPEAKEFVGAILAEVYKTGEAYYGYEFPVNLNRHGKLETGYYNFVYHPLKENKVISGFMVVVTEVTATVKAKQIIEENEEKLKLIIDASDLGVWDLNIKTNEFVASERCYTILGFPDKENLTPEDIITHVHPDDLKLRTEAFDKAFEVGFLHYQIRIIWEDQSLHWKEVKGKVFYDANDQPERMLGTVRDITEERNFHQQLLEREEKFRLLADSMPQHIWTADLEGNLNYFNRSVFDYSGLTLKQLNKNGWIQIVHPDDRKENIKQWKHAISTGNDFLFEHRFRRHNGEYRWQLSRAIPQKDADGAIKMWVGTSTDIQDQKMFTSKLEKMVRRRTNELRQKNMDLEKINEELQSFVYISSHDLQEPLRKIQIFASRIIETEYAALSENGRNYFKRMQRSANRMQNLIQDLIAYSRTNAQEIKFEVVDLLEIIEAVKETLSEELEQNDVTIKLKNNCEVKIIPVQFNQVMLNLVSNSIKFSGADHPIIIKIDCEIVAGKRIAIASLNDKKQYCHIRYSDNGIGFDQQYSGKIFEVFQRLHSKEEYTGTGIGLAIVKKIIENHDGIILAKGELNRGATFDIYIPAQ